jgi:hypothetical protein
MWILLALIVVGAAVALVAHPILRPPLAAFSTEDTHQQELADWEARKESVLRAIKDLEFDYRVGKVSAEDFQAFSARLKEEAAQILRQIDALRAESDLALSEALEAEIATLRKTQRAGTIKAASASASPDVLEQALEAEIQRLRRRSSVVSASCPRCGHRVGSEDRFCAQCGAPLTSL